MGLQEITSTPYLNQLINKINNLDSLNHWVGFRSDNGEYQELAYIINRREGLGVQFPIDTVYNSISYTDSETNFDTEYRYNITATALYTSDDDWSEYTSDPTSEELIETGCELILWYYNDELLRSVQAQELYNRIKSYFDDF